MLALTGAKADGWLPSAATSNGPAAADERGDRRGGRRPAAPPTRSGASTRRQLGTERASGARRVGRAARRADPVDRHEHLSDGGVASADDVRRFAEEVAPAVRELVAAARGRRASAGGAGARRGAAGETAGGRADARRRARAQRRAGLGRDHAPDRPAARAGARLHGAEQAAGRHLIDVHDAFAAELNRLRELIEQVSRGKTDPAAVRSYINRMTIRQNNWTLGAFCETYCRVGHQPPHARGPQRLPAPGAQRRRTSSVIKRLEEEHEAIADLLERSTERSSRSSAPTATASTGVRAWTCSPTPSLRTSPTRSASWSSRSPGRASTSACLISAATAGCSPNRWARAARPCSRSRTADRARQASARTTGADGCALALAAGIALHQRPGLRETEESAGRRTRRRR